ncbi:hypothetical protein D3C75_719760 [compost metagenome]
MQGFAAQQYEDQQATEQHDVQVGQTADAVFHTRYRCHGSHAGHDQDHHQQVGLAVVHAEQVFQAGGHLHRADAQVGHQAQQGDEHAEDVDGVAGSALDPTLAHQRVQRRAQCQRLVVAVGKVTHGQADQGIDRPAVQAPVQEGQLQALARGLEAGRGALRWVEVVVQRLGGAEVQQRNADTGGEQHAGPGAVAEVGLVILAAKLELAVVGEGQVDDEQQVTADYQHVVPAEGARQPFLGHAQHLAGGFGYSDKQGSQNEDHQRGGEEHHAVDPYPLGRRVGK